MKSDAGDGIDFKKRCFDNSFLTLICVNNYSETQNFLNKLIFHKHFVNWAFYLRSGQSNCYLEANLKAYLCLVSVSLALLPTETEPAFFLLPASGTCSMLRQDFLDFICRAVT